MASTLRFVIGTTAAAPKAGKGGVCMMSKKRKGAKRVKPTRLTVAA